MHSSRAESALPILAKAHVLGNMTIVTLNSRTNLFPLFPLLPSRHRHSLPGRRVVADQVARPLRGTVVAAGLAQIASEARSADGFSDHRRRMSACAPTDCAGRRAFTPCQNRKNQFLLEDATRLILSSMQFSDFLNAGGGLVDTVRMVLFRMLPRGAQIQKVRGEINNSLLRNYGKMTKLEVDKENRSICAELDMKGEKESIRITLSHYRLIQTEGGNPLFEPGTIEVSREWLDALLKTLVKTSVIPRQIEVKNVLHQTVVKSIL